MRINWKVFQENSSTEEAVMDFAEGVTSVRQFEKDCWPKDCKKMVRKLKRLPVRLARRRARDFINRNYTRCPSLVF